MNKHFKFALFLIIYWAGIISILSQENKVDYSFKKGEVFDILLLTNGAEAKTLFPRYLETVFPVGTAFSFQPVPGLSIAQTLQGGVHPLLQMDCVVLEPLIVDLLDRLLQPNPSKRSKLSQNRTSILKRWNENLYYKPYS